jgi:hypothetical protein
MRRYAGEMRRSVNQLVAMVDDLFELARIDAFFEYGRAHCFGFTCRPTRSTPWLRRSSMTCSTAS